MKIELTNTINSNKFYNLEIVNNEIIATYGKIGSNGKTESKGTFSNNEEVFFEFCKIIKSKTVKGYRENVINKNLAYPQIDMTETEFPILNGFTQSNDFSEIGFDTKYFLQYKLSTICSATVINDKLSKLIHKYFDMFSIEEDGNPLFEDDLTYERYEEEGIITLSSILLHYNGKEIEDKDYKECFKYLKKLDSDYYDDLGNEKSYHIDNSKLYVICQYIGEMAGLRFDDGGDKDNWIYFESE